jgi:hypothetical protein
MEGLTRNDNDVTWKTNGIVLFQPFHNATDTATTCFNVLTLRCIVFSSVYSWNLIMIADSYSYYEQRYGTNAAFNILVNSSMI